MEERQIGLLGPPERERSRKGSLESHMQHSGLRSPLRGRAFPGELDSPWGSLRRAGVRAPLEPTSFHPIPELGDELCSLL